MNIKFMEKVQLQVGDVVKGVVKETRKTYALVSLGVLNAFLPSIEYSWHKDCNIKSVMKAGDVINAVVINLSGNDIVLSIKRLRKDPWKTIDEKYVIGQKVKGKINKILGFGAFVILEDGLIGLLHKSELSLNGDIEPSSIFKENQGIETEIISIDKDKKRMSFSIKYQL